MVGLLDQLLLWFGTFPTWIVAATTVVTAATAITALTPTNKDDAVLGRLLKVLNILSGNFLRNRNKDDRS